MRVGKTKIPVQILPRQPEKQEALCSDPVIEALAARGSRGGAGCNQNLRGRKRLLALPVAMGFCFRAGGAQRNRRNWNCPVALRPNGRLPPLPAADFTAFRTRMQLSSNRAFGLLGFYCRTGSGVLLVIIFSHYHFGAKKKYC